MPLVRGGGQDMVKSSFEKHAYSLHRRGITGRCGSNMFCG